MHIEEQKTVPYFYFSGSCFPRQAYATLYRPPAMPQDTDVRLKAEYAFDSLRVKDEDSVLSPNNRTVALEFTRVVEGVKDEKCFQRKLVVGSCRLLDSKLEKPTSFEIIMPVADLLLRKTTVSNATPPRARLPQERKLLSVLPTSQRMLTPSS